MVSLIIEVVSLFFAHAIPPKRTGIRCAKSDLVLLIGATVKTFLSDCLCPVESLTRFADVIIILVGDRDLF